MEQKQEEEEEDEQEEERVQTTGPCATIIQKRGFNSHTTSTVPDSRAPHGGTVPSTQ